MFRRIAESRPFTLYYLIAVAFPTILFTYLFVLEIVFKDIKGPDRITSYNVCYTKLLRDEDVLLSRAVTDNLRITSYNVCYTKLLRGSRPAFMSGTQSRIRRSNPCAFVSNTSSIRVSSSRSRHFRGTWTEDPAVFTSTSIRSVIFANVSANSRTDRGELRSHLTMARPDSSSDPQLEGSCRNNFV